MANEADAKCCFTVSGLVKQATAIKNHGKCTEQNAISERWVVSTIVLPKSALRKCSPDLVTGKLGQTSKAGNMRWLETIKDEKDMEKKNHFLLRILAVVGRYGSHLMIVMIFVTQNNF